MYTLKIITEAENKKYFENIEAVIFIDNYEQLASKDILLDTTYNWLQNIAILNNNSCLKLLHAPYHLLASLPTNSCRINCWPTFINNPSWEYVGDINKSLLSFLETKLEKKLQLVPDLIGMISANIIASIINEAYIVLDNNIASASDIDTAMKLGTNYPYGPIEWSNKIGIIEIAQLLLAKATNKPAYAPALGLLKAANL
jgi:3-hydroxybutyryl-CoA dehydrogenase